MSLTYRLLSLVYTWLVYSFSSFNLWRWAPPLGGLSLRSVYYTKHQLIHAPYHPFIIISCREYCEHCATRPLAPTSFEGWRTTPSNSQVPDHCWIVTGWAPLTPGRNNSGGLSLKYAVCHHHQGRVLVITWGDWRYNLQPVLCSSALCRVI